MTELKSDTKIKTDFSEPQTGDLVLFESITPCACCVSLWTKSSINHVGIVIRDIEIDCNEFKGIYILESGLELVSENQPYILPFGTQIQPLKTFLTQNINIYYRSLNIERNQSFINSIKDIYKTIKQAPYDLRISVWAELFEVVVLDKNLNNITTINQAEKQKEFTCSAMVAYILTKLGFSILESVNGNWNMITPKFFNDLKVPWLEPRKSLLKIEK